MPATTDKITQSGTELKIAYAHILEKSGLERVSDWIDALIDEPPHEPFGQLIPNPNALSRFNERLPYAYVSVLKDRQWKYDLKAFTNTPPERDMSVRDHYINVFLGSIK